MASDELVSSSSGTQLQLLNNQNDNSQEHEHSERFTRSGSTYKRNRTYSQWSPSEEGITLAWSDLSVYTKVKKKRRVSYKRLINGVSGAVKAGSLVAIMGASGAGKSTLMSALAHRSTGGLYTEGDVLINGRPIGDYMKHLSGFMHQDDVFVGSLTVMEHMKIMSHLKLDRRTTSRERNVKTMDLLKQLGLLHCINTRIGRSGDNKALSGGERKRLAFATELLTDPPILFCDEPTTGLDSYSAQKLVSMMNMMASNGKTIMCTIHQPSSDIFVMFSQLILVADGRIAFMGGTAKAIDFFEMVGYECPKTYNPADFLIKTLAVTPGSEGSSKQSIKRICDQFAVSDYYKEVDVVLQYEFHMGRTVEVIGIMVGLCYLGTNSKTQSGIQSVQGTIFLMVTENTFSPMYSVLDDFPQKYHIFLREYKSGLYPSAIYYLSRVFSMLPGLIIEPVLFVVIVYWMSGLRASTYAFLMTNLVAILTMNVATACGVFFSTAFDSSSNAMAYLVPFDYVLMITSGLFIKLSTLPLLFSWVKYLSWLMYAVESISIIQWNGVQNITCEAIAEEIPCTTNGSQVLARYSFSQENLSRDLWSMFLLCVIFYMLGYFCLWYKTKQN